MIAVGDLTRIDVKDHQMSAILITDVLTVQDVDMVSIIAGRDKISQTENLQPFLAMLVQKLRKTKLE